jgi:hypothetical protein
MLDFFFEPFSYSSCAPILPEFGMHLKEILLLVFSIFSAVFGGKNLYHFDVARGAACSAPAASAGKMFNQLIPLSLRESRRGVLSRLVDAGTTAS